MRDLLTGIRVIEMASWTFVPSSGALLAQWGADVIKLERPGGDPQRGLFSTDAPEIDANRVMMEHCNRGKRSVVLDLRDDRGRRAFHALVGSSDVLLTNSLSAPLIRLGADLDAVRAINPEIIYARGTGHGSRGPDAEAGGYDVSSGMARVGMLHEMMPRGATEPPLAPPAMVDLQAGYNLATGVLAAVLRRERTGRTSVVDASLLAAGMWMMAPNLLTARVGARLLRTEGHHDPAIHPLLNNYRTADGRWLYLVFLESDRYWHEFCQRIGRTDLRDRVDLRDQKARVANRDTCIAVMDELIGSRTLREWRDVFSGMSGPWAPAQTYDEASLDPQVVATSMIGSVATEVGVVPVMDAPIELDGERFAPERAAPGLGEHTAEVLSEIGIDPEECNEQP